MTGLGTKLQDAFLSIIHTSLLLSIDAYQDIIGRINGDAEFFLPDLVKQRIQESIKQ